MWQYSASLFVSKRPNKERAFVLAIVYLFLFFLHLFGLAWLNILSFLLVNFFFLSTQFDLRWEMALFHAAIVTAVMAMGELTVYGLISRFSPHFFSDPSLFHRTILLAVLSKTLYFMVAYFLSHSFRSQKKNLPSDPSVLFLGLIPLASSFIMIALINIGENESLSPANSWMISLSGIFLLLINLLVFGINQYSQQKNARFTEMQVLLQKEYDTAEYYKMLLDQKENQSILIHDIKKHLQAISLLNENGDSHKVSAYIRQLLESSDLKESAKTCGHEMLNAILSRYRRQCYDKDIDFIVDIRNGTADFLSENDLTALFCNLLDNAVEAAEGIPDGYMEISMIRKAPTDFVILSVINSCRTTPFAKDSHSLVSKKADRDRHGFGIKSIQRTVAKYQGDLQMYYSEDTKTFHTIITMIAPNPQK